MGNLTTPDVGVFDRFAGWVATVVSRAPFFAFCVLLVVVWAPSLPLFGSVDTWQLIINTATTIVTFLLVALLQNSQSRADTTTQQKLNAVAEGLRDLMEHVQVTAGGPGDFAEDIARLEKAVGLEEHVGTKKERS